MSISGMRQMRLQGLVDTHASLSPSVLSCLAFVSKRNDNERIAAASIDLSDKPATIEFKLSAAQSNSLQWLPSTQYIAMIRDHAGTISPAGKQAQTQCDALQAEGL